MSATKDIALLGSAGQLGREWQTLLQGEVVQLLTRQDADLAIPGQITSVLQQLRPRLVINCSAYNLVDLAESSPGDAFATNVFGVRELALVCREIEATLVHFSTDYVFGLEGFRPQPYLESDAPGPVSTYGISKLAGEYSVRALCPRHFVIRTSGLYGRHGAGGKGTNFVEIMLKLGRSGKSIRVVDDQILTPSSASDLARTAWQLIQNAPFGLYHLTNSGQCSWFEFAQTIFEVSGIQTDLQPVSTAEYGSKAARPAYSVLTSEHRDVPRMRPWQEALASYLQSSR